MAAESERAVAAEPPDARAVAAEPPDARARRAFPGTLGRTLPNLPPAAPRPGTSVPNEVAKADREEHAKPRPHGARAIGRRLVVGTVASCFRYRVTGLAAEAAFFALVSFPPIILGLVATLGYFTQELGSDTLGELERTIEDVATNVLSQETVDAVVSPITREVLTGGRADIISLSFLIALWSGSRALNVYVDTISIAYGLGGHRGIVRTRALSFTLYIVGMVLATIALPLVTTGPALLHAALPGEDPLVSLLYWPLVIVLSLVFLATLYHASVPVRTSWLKAVPGAVLAFVIWLAGSLLLRYYLSITIGGASIYGPLAAPVAVLFWLYVTALAVLIGSALNAEIDKLWPSPATARARGLQQSDATADSAESAST